MTTSIETNTAPEPLAELLLGLDASGFNHTELRMLLALRRRHSTSVTGLGQAAGVSAAVASRDVERLARRGFVERRADPRDRRCCLVSLTDAGRAELARVETELWRPLEAAGG
jgi:DNA-binding MarR family transcriptional regulator